jgi:Tfp pilus assembly protein PilN
VTYVVAALAGICVLLAAGLWYTRWKAKGVRLAKETAEQALTTVSAQLANVRRRVRDLEILEAERFARDHKERLRRAQETNDPTAAIRDFDAAWSMLPRPKGGEGTGTP